MATYVIGDIQGCFGPLERLLAEIAFDARRDRLLLVGDLVNRGPHSLEVLRWAADTSPAVETVLGNHDLHLLARAAGRTEARPGDTLDAVLSAPDRDDLLDWLSRRPLVLREGRRLLVHAGLHPAWSAEDACALAAPIEDALADPSRRGDVLDAVVRWRGHPQPAWHAALPQPERTAAVVGLLTRLRVCSSDGVPCASFNGPPRDAPAGVQPWFDIPGRRSRDVQVLFGHWAALGLVVRDDVIGLDTGCVWGGVLTALRLEDGTIFQQPSEMPRRPS